MTTIFVRFANDDGQAGSGAPLADMNNVYADKIGSGQLLADLIDSSGAPTGVSLTEGASPFASGGQSFAFADESPDARLPVGFFQAVWFAGGTGEKFVLSGFSPGQEYTLELAGQNANSRDTLFSATNSSPASALYEVQADPDPDPFIATQPVVLTGTADASGNVSIIAEVVAVTPYCNGFILTYDQEPDPTATLSGNLQPDTTFTITSSGLTPPASVSITDSVSNAITVPVTTVGDTSTGTMPALPATDSAPGLLFGAVSVNFAGEILSAQYLPPAGLTLTTVAAGYDPYLTQTWTTKPVAGDQFLHDATQFSLTSALVAETEQVGQFDLWYINQSGQNFALYLSSENLQAAGDGSVPGGTVTIGQSLNPRRLGNRKSARQAVNKATYQAIYRS